MSDPREWLWDITIHTTQPALARFAEAIIRCRARVVDAHAHTVYGPRDFGRGVSAFVRVQLAAGTEDKFRDICKPLYGEMKPPPLVDCGVPMELVGTPPPDDGHPGRKR